jgi:hypothetical protein
MQALVKDTIKGYKASTSQEVLILAGTYPIKDTNSQWTSIEIGYNNYVIVKTKDLLLIADKPKQPTTPKQSSGLSLGDGNKSGTGIGFGSGDGTGDYTNWYIAGAIIVAILILK